MYYELTRSKCNNNATHVSEKIITCSVHAYVTHILVANNDYSPSMMNL